MSIHESPGARLKDAREAQGKSLSDMAKVTRIGMRQLEGIEQDVYDRIPAPIYVKGFVRNYAQALGLDSAPLIEQVERILAGGDAAEEAAPRQTPGVPQPMQEETPSLGKEAFRPRTAAPKPSLKELLQKNLEKLRRAFSAVELPLDRRLAWIGGTVVLVLILVFGLRGCGKGADQTDPGASGEVRLEELERLLLATPEPILFELPRTTP